MDMKETEVFVLTTPGERERYYSFINDPGIEITNTSDTVTKEGEVIRIVDVRRRAGTQPYTPPLT